MARASVSMRRAASAGVNGVPLSLLVSVHRSHSRPLSSRPSKPHRSQKKSRVMPAQSRQMGIPSLLRPGSSRLVSHPGQHPRVRAAR